jgi:hypothetical protein
MATPDHHWRGAHQRPGRRLAKRDQRDLPPAADFNGSARIAYTISDGNGGTASAVLTVTILAVNDAPVALDDSASTPRTPRLLSRCCRTTRMWTAIRLRSQARQSPRRKGQ